MRTEKLFSIRQISDEVQNFQLIKNEIFIEMAGLTSVDIINIMEEVEEELRMEAILDECDVHENDSAVIIESLLNDVIFCAVCKVILNQEVACESDNFCEECMDTLAL